MCTKNIKWAVVTGIICLLFAHPGYAATYYVRTDGGTATQCTGLADAAYPGSGSNQACAFNHPFWAIAPNGGQGVMSGGDTLIIDGSNSAQYMIGFGAPNTSNNSLCNAYWAYDCVMRAIPSGPSPAQPTRILGKGWNSGCSSPPQLWGTERIWQVLNLQGSNNVELQCLEITDHSQCQEGGPAMCNRSSPPFGPWASVGISASDSSNVLLKNVNVHGLAKGGIRAGRLRDWTLEDSKIVANSFVGWDGDIGADASSNSGTMTFLRTKIQYNGCGETYPGKQPYNCYSQDQGGYGDGIGTHRTGANWVFIDSDISHNVSDGLDLLYHDGSGAVTIKRSRFEGNAGNQVKTATTTTINDSILVGNCAYFKDSSMTWQPSGFNNCRALGNTLSLSFRPGMTATVYNSTITGNGDALILSSGGDCNGSERITSRNNIFQGGAEFNSPGDVSALYFASGASGNGDGPCANVPLDDDYSIIWGTKTFSTDCNGKPHSVCQDPKLMQAPVTYYSGPAYDVNLQSNSPAITRANVLVGVSSYDFNSFDRGSVWDIGSLEYGSTPNGAPADPVCGDSVCNSNETCSSCSADCGACAPVCGDGTCSGAETCGSCASDCGACPPVCGDGACNGVETCNTCLGDCGACQSTPPACGDGSCNGTETCDTCSSDCGACAPRCGNGDVEAGEQCDDDNTDNGDGCSSTCTIEVTPVCGDGACNGTETCTTCVSDCGACAPVCGNGIKEGNEICDDGNLNNNDGCSSACRAEYCGDGIKQTNEECDDGNWINLDGCSALCKLETITPVCGDGTCNGTETCETCLSDCGICPQRCGNGDVEGSEECDDDNTEDGDGCSSACRIEHAPICGDGACNGTETCETCSSDCGTCAPPAEVCGNGVKESTEQCDDGNLRNGDGCSNTCDIEQVSTPPSCGNGVVEGNEQCDDGNRRSGDGCSRKCKIEAVCGNGVREGSEQCDDGNRRSGDGCSRYCRTER